MPRALFSHETPHVLWFPALKIGQRSVYTPVLTPKWRQNGTWLANWPELIFSTRARGATRKNLTFFAGIEFGRFGLLQNWGKSTLEIMVKAGVFPALYGCWKAAGAGHKDQEMAQNGRFSQAEGWWASLIGLKCIHTPTGPNRKLGATGRKIRFHGHYSHTNPPTIYGLHPSKRGERVPEPRTVPC